MQHTGAYYCHGLPEGRINRLSEGSDGATHMIAGGFATNTARIKRHVGALGVYRTLYARGLVKQHNVSAAGAVLHRWVDDPIECWSRTTGKKIGNSLRHEVFQWLVARHYGSRNSFAQSLKEFGSLPTRYLTSCGTNGSIRRIRSGTSCCTVSQTRSRFISK